MLNKDNCAEEERMITKEELEEIKTKDNKQNRKSKKKKTNDNLNTNNLNKKVFLYSLSIIIFSILASFFIKRSYSTLGELNIEYQENSNLDYKVYLKKNEFYESNYLGKNMVYVASLIDKITIDYNYIFKIDKKSSIDFTYDIVGKLIISDRNNENTFFEKEYILLEKEKETMNNEKTHKINKNVSIDYNKYNNLANKFRTKYGVDTNSKLIVYLNIYEKNNKNNSFKLDNTSNMSLSIPLSEKAINIAMDYNEVNKASKLLRNKQLVITNYIYIVLGAIFAILLIIITIKYIKILLSTRIKKSKYDKYINKLLREYDRLIVETTTAPDNNIKKNIVEIGKFQELLDVRDNLKLPIKYYSIKEHEESCFYINNNEELYLFKISEKELENN